MFGFFKALSGKAKQTTASKERSTMRGQEAVTGPAAVGRNIASDLSIGFSTFGMNQQDQAAKMRSMGYSSAAVKDYQDRTQASKDRRAAAAAAKAARKSTEPDSPPASSTMARTVSAAPAGTTSATSAGISPPGATITEGESIDEAKTTGQAGFAGTIATSPSGITSDEEALRKRQSLMRLIT